VPVLTRVLARRLMFSEGYATVDGMRMPDQKRRGEIGSLLALCLSTAGLIALPNATPAVLWIALLVIAASLTAYWWRPRPPVA
jgi:hypothetical protein